LYCFVSTAVVLSVSQATQLQAAVLYNLFQHGFGAKDKL
jgi:hypothetical protein